MCYFLSKHKLTLKFVNHFWQTITKNWTSSHACWNTRWVRWAGLQHFLCGTLLELINKEIFPEKMIEHKCTTQYNLLLLLLKVHLSSSTFVKHRFPKYSCTYCTYNMSYMAAYLDIVIFLHCALLLPLLCYCSKNQP